MDAGKPTRVKSKTPPKKGKAGLIVIIVAVVLIAGFVMMIAFNWFNFREGVIMNYLRNAPLIGPLIPAAAEEDPYYIPLEEWPVGQLAARIRELEAHLARREYEIHNHEARERNYRLQIARLRPFYEHWSEYQRVSAEFNAIIARGDPPEFLRFIQYILPEFYEQLARDAMLLYTHNESVMAIVRSLGAMQERAAAAILEDLRLMDLDLLRQVLNAMSHTMRGEVVEHMEPDVASFMLRLISVPEPTLAPMAPALFSPALPELYEDLYADEYDEYFEEEDDDE